MKKIIPFFILLSINCLVFSQIPTLDWVKQMGGVGSIDDYGNSIAVDHNGNVYTTGQFDDTSDFDPGPGIYNLTSNMFANVFISKLNGSGNFNWAKQVGGPYDEIGYSIDVDASGNVYTAGMFMGTVDFDPGPGIYNLISVGGMEIFVSKLDASGNFIWAKQMGGVYNDWAYSIDVDMGGNVYVTGVFESTADFDPGAGVYNLVSAGQYDVFACKLDTWGNLVWASAIGGAEDDRGYSIAYDEGGTGNVYLTGFFRGTADFDPGAGVYNLTSSGGWDVFVSKLGLSGNLIWAKRVGGISHDFGQSIAVDDLGFIYIAGYFNDTANFDPGPGTYNLFSFGYSDIFVAKWDVSGNFIWTKQLGGAGSDMAHAIALDVSGNVYTTGWFNDSADFDPGPGIYNLSTLFPDQAIFISKLDPSGNFVWALQCGTGKGDLGNDIVVKNGDIYVTGSFDGTTDFDPGIGIFNLSPIGGHSNIFVLKLINNSVGLDDVSLANNLFLSPNPATNQLTIENAELKIELIEIYNTLGEKIFSQISNLRSQISVDVSQLPLGIYFLKVKGGKEEYVAKFVKQ